MEFIEVTTQEDQLNKSANLQADGTSRVGESSASPQNSFREANCQSLEKDEFSPTENTNHQAMKLTQYNQTGIKLKFIKDICPTPINLAFPEDNLSHFGAREQLFRSNQIPSQSPFGKAAESDFKKQLHSAMLPSGALFSPVHISSLSKGSSLEKSAAIVSSSPAMRSGLFHIQLFLTNQYLDESPYSSTEKNMEETLILKNRPQ